jgi:hypothetical protein
LPSDFISASAQLLASPQAAEREPFHRRTAPAPAPVAVSIRRTATATATAVAPVPSSDPAQAPAQAPVHATTATRSAEDEQLFAAQQSMLTATRAQNEQLRTQV